MRFAVHADLAPGKHARAFEKVKAAIERDDFRSADVKKLRSNGLYRAKLDDTNRLLLQFVRRAGETVCVAVELIENHAYDRSRFLRGAPLELDEADVAPPAEAAAIDATPVPFIHPTRVDFQFLDKPLSLDDAQDAIYRLRPPMVLVGAAGSGKTALALAKLRLESGDVAYVTRSQYLAARSREVYFSHGFERDGQTAEFLSLAALVESVRIPEGRAVRFKEFAAWFERQRQGIRFADAHQVFEEIRGVLTSQPEGPLSRDAYLALGVKQSIFAPAEREIIHRVFDAYRSFLASEGLYEPNLVAHALLADVTPRYDFVVVDEVQDLTNVELALVLRVLREKGRFVLAGDANQIVHPNFFAWSAVKSLFFRDASLGGAEQVAVLEVNYRNARAVTALANALLKVKHARFGSVDRETNTLVRAATDVEGAVTGLPDDERVLADLDAKTRRSADVAVLVLRDEHKEAARRRFRTPLVFSVHEAKGLEYRSVVLYRFVSSERAAYREI
ncbi:MAG TPA: UvrD-helicase domain-containing protein, partial [Minicystis sp.]|nr:UvrD-helicase domain-containing protein [Minicystis sp.]